MVSGTASLRASRGIVYVALAATLAGSILGSFADKDWDTGAGLLEACQMLGLAAMGALLAAMSIGPLTSVFPSLPLRGHLLYARRAVGVSAYVLAAAHAGLYLVPALLRDWHELFQPDWTWPTGLALGVLSNVALFALTITSRDAAVRSMGARWKRMHRLVYAGLPVALVHALLLGSDFGVRPAMRGVAGDAG
jgi:DMSO/TMAO reductase YedYZ heme-binding membrane subunit